MRACVHATTAICFDPLTCTSMPIHVLIEGKSIETARPIGLTGLYLSNSASGATTCGR